MKRTMMFVVVVGLLGSLVGQAQEVKATSQRIFTMNDNGVYERTLERYFDLNMKDDKQDLNMGDNGFYQTTLEKFLETK